MFTSAVGGDWNRAIRANRWRKIQVKWCSVECRLHRGPTVPFSSIEPHPISNKPSLNMLHPDPVVLTHRHQPPKYAGCNQDPWIVPWERSSLIPSSRSTTKADELCSGPRSVLRTTNRHEWKQNVWCLCWLCWLKHWRYKTSHGDDGVWFQRVLVFFCLDKKLLNSTLCKTITAENHRHWCKHFLNK